MTRLVDENGAPRYLIVEFSKTEAEQPAQDCTVQAAAQGEKTKGLRDACKMKGLTKAQILALHAAMVRGFGGTDGLRKESLLDSALNAPLQAFSGAEAYPSMARLGFGLIGNRAFLDETSGRARTRCWFFSRSTGSKWSTRRRS